MLTNQQLATMTVRNVIFHDVPNDRGDGGTGVVLATDPTRIDARQRRLLTKKLTKVLDSRSAYGITFADGTSSPVPSEVRIYTNQGYREANFVEASQHLATHLHQVQNRTISPGLLCVIDIVVDGRHGLIIMKLEREEGAQLELERSNGRTQFAMSVLENLVLTDGTKLFKTAAFLRTGTGDDDFDMSACDSQHRVLDSTEMARFWLSYLGCTVEEDARVTTSKFFNTTVEFANTYVTDLVDKTHIYESLNTELRSNKRNIIPRDFVRDYVPEGLQRACIEFLEERHVPLRTFVKDVEDVRAALRKLTYVSEEGVRISVPEGQDGLVEVDEERIVVNDRLKSVGRA
ncbi:MAG: nucleoid-associated protein [Terracidiphilus sp.]